MRNPLTLSSIFGKFLSSFLQTSHPQSVDTNCEQSLFLVFQVYIKFFLANSFNMITNDIVIKQYVFRQYLSHHLKCFTPPPSPPHLQKKRRKEIKKYLVLLHHFYGHHGLDPSFVGDK